MTQNPDIPDAFDVLTIVVLRRPASGGPDLTEDELDALQILHLGYRADLARRGLVVVNGPFDEQSDPAYRGMSVFTTDLAEAARLTDLDPAVQAGRLEYDVMEWWVAGGTLAFPSHHGAVGDRRTLTG